MFDKCVIHRPSLFAWLAAAAFVAALFAYSPNFGRWQAGPQADPPAGDFLQEWVGGSLVLRGERERFYDPAFARRACHRPEVVPFAWDESQYLPLVYPPFYYVLVSPLAMLSYWQAAAAWSLLMTAALAAAVVLLQRAAGKWVTNEVNSPAVVFLPLLAVFYVPAIESLSSGQKGTVCLLIWIATYALLARGKPLWAGSVFGWMLFKPQLAIVMLAAMICMRAWRFLFGAALTGALLAALSFAMGVDVCRQYAEFLLHAGEYLRTSGYDLHKSHGLYGFFALLVGVEHLTLARILSLACGAAVIAALAVIFRRSRGEQHAPPFDWSEPPGAMRFSAMIVATLLLSPHLFTYDLTPLLFPIVFSLAAAHAALRENCERKSPRLCNAALAAAMYVASGFSVALAARTGVQITVPLMAAWLATSLMVCGKLEKGDFLLFPRPRFRHLETLLRGKS